MAGQTKKMNWVSTPTAWRQLQQWKQKQQERTQRLEAMQAAGAGFGEAALNHISQSGTLAVQAAIDRNAAAAKAKAAALEKQRTKEAWEKLV
jgi:hypothetical protein